MNQVAQLAETVEQKQIFDIEQTEEEFEVIRVRIDDGQFNMTVKNNGDIPVHITRLWVANTTDATWPESKFDLDHAIASGNSLKNIGQNIGLSALTTQSYQMKIITERGNHKQLFLNTVGDESNYLNLRATPATIASGFTTTLLLEVVNTGTTQLLNLQPEIDSIITSCASCSYNQVSGANPTSIESLDPGDTAIFEYVYSLTGEHLDSATITASLVNGINSDSTSVAIQEVESAANANVALSAIGIGPAAPLSGSLLIFHMENAGIPGGTEYQMYSGTPEGGTDGLRIQLESEDPTFMTNNGTTLSTPSVPAGNWVASLALQSEAMPPSLIDEDVSMIFHFEDGQDVDLDNSEGSSARDLQGCAGVGCSGWYHNDWSSRKQVVIQGDRIVGTHTNFPVMVKLTTDAELIASAQADGDDILFTTSDGLIKLDHEIESYSGGTLVAWVKVPSLSSGTDTAICMYYGNAAVGSQENITGTWSDNYEAVYHFNDDFLDSTSNNRDGTNSGTVDIAGIAGDGQDFEARDADYVNAGTWSVSGNQLSLQAWVYWESNPNDDPRIISKQDPSNTSGSTQSHVFMLGEDSKRVRERVKTGESVASGTSTLLAGTGTMSKSVWYLMSATYDGINMRVFLDGVDRGNTGKTGHLLENSWPVYIGSQAGSPREFDGIMDEVRISSEARSANWFQTEFNNLKPGDTPFIIITAGGSGGNPTWVADSGPHGSGSYLFDGVNDCLESKNNVSNEDDNNIDEEVDTTALWFKTAGGELGGGEGDEQYLVYWDGDGTCPACDYYKISLDPTGKILFEFDSNQGSATTTCLTTNDYDDDTWYHVTAVRGVAGNDNTNADDCVLHVHDITGASLEKVNKAKSFPSSNVVTTDGRWTVGTNQEKDDYFFNGYIDDIIHWNGDSNGNGDYLDTAEAQNLARTNYGDAAHKVDFYLTVTDKDGNFLRNLVSDLEIDIPFQDPKTVPSSSTENNDALYSYFNYTMPLTAQTFAIGERLNFTMNWVSSTTEFPNWEPLDLDMKVDDTGFTQPFPSYMQIPTPTPSFPSYYIYDNDVELNIFVSTIGTEGVYYIAQGTRAAFNGTQGSFAGLIHTINGTTSDFVVDDVQDSIYFAPGEVASTFFYVPTDHPSITGLGTTIPPGAYTVSVWAEGYSDQGESFSRKVTLGTVTVVD